MRVIHLIENIDSRYGGPSRSVIMDCIKLKQSGYENTIYSTRWFINEQNDLIKENNINWQVFDLSIRWKKVSFSLSLKKKLLSIIDEIDIIHLHNSYNYTSYLAYIAKKKYNKKVFFTLRGNLFNSSTLSGFIFKKIIWHAYFKNFLKKCDAVIVTNRNDELHLKNSLNLTNIFYLANSINLNPLNKTIDQEAYKSLDLKINEHYLLFMGRIHPHKGVHILLNAAIEAIKIDQNLNIIIAGPIGDRRYFNKLDRLIVKNGLNKKIRFLGQVQDKIKNTLYLTSDFLVLPSKSENFGMSIAESLYLGTPVITTQNTPWKDIENFNSGFIVSYENATAELKFLLDSIYIKKEVDISTMKSNAKLYFERFLNMNYRQSISDIYDLKTYEK